MKTGGMDKTKHNDHQIKKLRALSTVTTKFSTSDKQIIIKFRV